METTSQKSLLITVRDAISCSQGVCFVGSFFKKQDDLLLTLFYVMPNPVPDQSMMDPWADDNAIVSVPPSEIAEVFTLCTNVLLKKGFSEKQIEKVARKKQSGTVQDIISEGEKGLYDAIILGKKSTSFLKNILSRSMGDDILEKELTAPVWFCRDPDENRKNVLLCLDGSPMGEKVADHVGYVLQNEDHHSVTLFYVDKGQGVDQEKIFRDATEVLNSYGIADARINTSTVTSLRVTNAILAKAEREKFAVIAIGSIGRTATKGICDRIVGTKCKNIFNEIDKAALWIVP
ncbi:MAG: universal stress protein [Desulfobulbaceae bacterium]|jgi:nucleotide-binding universal stress UspA family protein|nr:universal stress protein [Desulfobulbaceae bacterium]